MLQICTHRYNNSGILAVVCARHICGGAWAWPWVWDPSPFPPETFGFTVGVLRVVCGSFFMELAVSLVFTYMYAYVGRRAALLPLKKK